MQVSWPSITHGKYGFVHYHTNNVSSSPIPPQTSKEWASIRDTWTICPNQQSKSPVLKKYIFENSNASQIILTIIQSLIQWMKDSSLNKYTGNKLERDKFLWYIIDIVGIAWWQAHQIKNSIFFSGAWSFRIQFQ